MSTTPRTDDWIEFAKLIHSKRGYDPHPRDTLAKDQFEIYQAGKRALESELTSLKAKVSEQTQTILNATVREDELKDEVASLKSTLAETQAKLAQQEVWAKGETETRIKIAQNLAETRAKLEEMEFNYNEATRVAGEDAAENQILTAKLNALEKANAWHSKAEASADREADSVRDQNLSLTAALKTAREALELVSDALEYGGVGDDRPLNRLIALIESERSTCTGDNWDYWNYLSEKIQALSQPVSEALSAIRGEEGKTVSTNLISQRAEAPKQPDN